tara:strand:- start:1784 stop:2254 length:471 start_codon:yes stop_codon:yes gene_type:complete
MLEINLKTIAETAVKKEVENRSFANYLKEQNVGKIDQIAQRVAKDITDKIDCVACGSCCNNLRPIATTEELRKFVVEEKIEKYRYLERFSCKNLDSNDCKKCTVYLDRPQECRDFPYMDRDNFAKRTIGILQNYKICPIVFNTYESLKDELNWKPE